MAANFVSGQSVLSNRSGTSSHKSATVGIIRLVKSNIKAKKLEDAYTMLQASWITYPDNPIILSYYGSLHAIVEKKYRAGIAHCLKAISMISDESALDEYLILPELYLNLGRAYVAANMINDAFCAYRKGLKYGHHQDLVKELRACDRRSKPALPFLDRSNPINKYVGLAMRRGLRKKK